MKVKKCDWCEREAIVIATTPYDELRGCDHHVGQVTERIHADTHAYVHRAGAFR